MRSAALAMASLMLVGAAPQDVDDGEIVTIRKDWAGESVCTGICPRFKVDVSPGWVTGFTIGDQPFALRIAPADYAKFRKRMAKVRPGDLRQNARVCGKTDFLVMTEVVWYPRWEGAVRRVSCGEAGDGALDCAVSLALIDIGVDPIAGEPIVAPYTRQFARESVHCVD